jgi:hypothetical protein
MIVVCGMSDDFMALNDGLMGLYTVYCNVFVPMFLRKVATNILYTTGCKKPEDHH